MYFINSIPDVMAEEEFLDSIVIRQKIKRALQRWKSPSWNMLSKKQKEEMRNRSKENTELRRICKEIDIQIKRDRQREYWLSNLT